MTKYIHLYEISYSKICKNNTNVYKNVIYDQNIIDNNEMTLTIPERVNKIQHICILLFISSSNNIKRVWIMR